MLDEKVLEEIKKCAEVMAAGGLILYPTDTIWGIGCDATNAAAVEKVFALKKRNSAQSLISLVSDNSMLNKCVREVPSAAWDIMEYSEKPVTIVYDNAFMLAENVVSEDGTAAIRLTKDEFCNRLVHKFKKPVISTSANISGEPNAETFHDISNEIKSRVDYIVRYRQHEKKQVKPSSVIQIKNNGVIKIIRK